MADDTELEEGTIEEIDEEESDIEETDDGGAIIRDTEVESDEVESGFYDNIVDELDDAELSTLASDMITLIEFDKKSREKRDKQYEEAIKRTGLGNEAPGGADFNGASRVVHPMLTKASVDFGSRTIAELFPANGPVKDFIPGEPTEEQMTRAKRKVTYMNWQFITQMKECRGNLEKVLSQVPLGGSQYMGLVYDSRKRRPVPTPIMIDDVYLPYAADSLYTSERVTVVEHITKMEYMGRVRDGIYRDIDMISPSLPPEATKSEEARKAVEGKEHNWYNEDGLRDMYRLMCFANLEEEYGEQPYMVEICSVSHKVASVIRNWDKNLVEQMELDPEQRQEPMFWMVEFGFIPWTGVYHIGLAQLIGGLSGAATGALRALLDSAHIQNFPSLVKLKGMNLSGQSVQLNVCSITDIEGPVGGEADIRKLMMSLPFNQTSPVLMNLLAFLVQEGGDVIRMVYDKLGDVGQNAPVGTTLALIEQAMKIFNAIHLRLVGSMTRLIEILQRINRMYLTDEDIVKQTGKQMARVEDFQKPDDVIPTADPEIFSDVQRWAQVQLIAQRATNNPLYNQRKVEELILNRTKMPDALQLLLPEQKPEDMNAVNENLALVLGRPVAAMPEQDHLAHIQVLLDFMESPVLGQLPIIAPTFLGGALNHLKEHMAMWYVNAHVAMLEQASGKQVKELMKSKDPRVRKELDKTLAASSDDVVKLAMERFKKIPEIVAKAQKLLASMQPPGMQPMDPSAAALQAKQMDVQVAKDKIVADTQKTQLKLTSDLQREQFKQGAEDNRTQLEVQSKRAMNQEDNMTALTIANAEISSGENVALSTGTGINPGS